MIAEAILNKFHRAIELSGVCDLDKDKARGLLKGLKARAGVFDIDELIRRCDLLVEAASASVSYRIARQALDSGKDVLVMSTGGLLGREGLFALAEERRAKIYLPSGAVCGLDGLKSAMAGKVTRVVLTTKKPPRGLEGAPYIAKKGIDIKSIKNETVIFEGTAEEAVKAFPKNVNVSATLSMCGLGGMRTMIRVVTSPGYKSNTHEIEVEGDFGRLKAVTENVPSPNNPKTSYLAALSAIAMLKNITGHSAIGN